MSKITKILADGSINIEYAYSSAVHVDGKIALILRASDIESTERILKANGVAVLTLTEFKKYFQRLCAFLQEDSVSTLYSFYLY